jgi:N-acetylmuramoyl-L-alanine amidase
MKCNAYHHLFLYVSQTNSYTSVTLRSYFICTRWCKMFKLYLDPGHGRMDPGAIGNAGMQEKITLNISRSIRNLLENHYEGLQIKMSRTADITRSLKERTDDANAFGTGAKGWICGRSGSQCGVNSETNQINQHGL